MSVKVSPSTVNGEAVSDVVCAIVSTPAVSIEVMLPLPELLEPLELLPLLEPLELELPELLLELLELITTSDEWWPQPVNRASANAVVPNSAN